MSHRLLAAAIALLVGVACDPLRDRHGCWVDGDEAFRTLWETICVAQASCEDFWTDSYESSNAYLDACVEQMTSASYISGVRDQYCFDGCLVDACLDPWLAYAESCADEDYLQIETNCGGDNSPFWDLWSSPNRSCLEDERGW